MDALGACTLPAPPTPAGSWGGLHLEAVPAGFPPLGGVAKALQPLSSPGGSGRSGAGVLLLVPARGCGATEGGAGSCPFQRAWTEQVPVHRVPGPSRDRCPLVPGGLVPRRSRCISSRYRGGPGASVPGTSRDRAGLYRAAPGAAGACRCRSPSRCRRRAEPGAGRGGRSGSPGAGWTGPGRAEPGLTGGVGAEPAEGPRDGGGGARSRRRSPGRAARRDHAGDEGVAGSAEHLPGHHRHPLRWHT